MGRLSKIDFSKLFVFGDGFVENKAQDLQNPFWKDLLQGWKKFMRSFKIDSLTEMLYSPIWFNSNLHRGGNLFIRNWHERGVRSIIDFYNHNGELYTFDEFKVTYNVQGTFLDYQSIARKIPNEWKVMINNHKNEYINIRYNVPCNTYVSTLLKGKKGCRKIYKILNRDENNSQDKWFPELGRIPIEEWRKYNKILHELKGVKLKDFQFKLNNKILASKSFLFRINKIDNNLCSYCGNNPETLMHLFIDCQKVNEFWHSLRICKDKDMQI